MFKYSQTKPLLFLLLSSLIISTSCDFKFNQNGEFTVLQFTDFHYCENEAADQKTEELQRRLLSTVKPDLVIVSGDAVGGYAGYQFYLFTDHGFFKKCWEKFTQPFIDAQVYYAYTLGNHDAEADFNRKQIVELDKTNEYSVLRTAESIPETATFRIPIYSSQNQSHLATNIWVFDSGSLGCGFIPNSWGCIQESHVDWYDQESKKIKEKYGSNVHHVAFYHIPIPEYINVFNEEDIYGGANEGIGCPYTNTGLFSKIRENKDISAMFVGHDHKNDFGGWYEDVEFVYGRKSGYGSYGHMHGARVIKFKETKNEKGEIVVTRDHYVIEEDGGIITTKDKIKKSVKYIQNYCHPVSENWFILLRATGFFDFMKYFVVGLVLAIVVWKFAMKKALRRCREKALEGKIPYVEDVEAKV